MSVFDVVADGSESFLRNLEDELKGTLHCIAHAGHNSLTFLRECQKYYREKYDSKINDKSNSVTFLALGIPAGFVLDAYEKFISIGDYDKPTSEEIESEADEILGEYLEIPPLYMFDEETRQEILNGWRHILDDYPKYLTFPGLGSNTIPSSSSF
jgi:hypothetical protein